MEEGSFPELLDAPEMPEAGGYEPDPTDVTRPALGDFQVKLKEEELSLLGRHLVMEIDAYNEQNAGRRSNIKQWRSDWRVDPVPSNRWPGASEVNSPLTRMYCASHASRLDQQIILVDPPLRATAKKPEAIQAAPQIEEAVTAKLLEAGWPDHASEVHQEVAHVGNVFTAVAYEEEVIRVPELQVEFSEQVFQALLEGDVPPEEAFGQAVAVDANGRPKTTLTFKNKLVFSGPRFRTIKWEDGVILPAHITDPKKRRGIGERLMLSGAELLAGVENDKYLKEEVAELLRRPSDDVPDDQAEDRDSQGLVADPDTEPADGHDNPAGRYYLCYELCWLKDWNNDGEEEWAIVTLHYASGRVLRVHYLPYEHGEPYFHLYRYITTTGQLWGQGIAEVVAVYHDADTALWNQWIDGLDLALNARNNFFYRIGSFDPAKHTSELAQPIPVDDLNGIREMNITPVPADMFMLRSNLKDAADLLTATSNPTMGKEAEGDKTLGEIQILMGASNQLSELYSSRVARQHSAPWDQFRYLLAQYGDGGQVEYRKSAEPAQILEAEDPNAPPIPGAEQMPVARIGGELVPAPGGVAFGSIPANVLRAAVDLEPTGITQIGDAQSRLQQAMVVLQTLTAHPLTAMMPDVQQEAIDGFLLAVRAPHRDKIMRMIAFNLQMQAAAQATATALAAAGGAAAGGVEGARSADEANTADAAAAEQAQMNAAKQQQMQEQSALAAQAAQAPAAPVSLAAP